MRRVMHLIGYDADSVPRRQLMADARSGYLSFKRFGKTGLRLHWRVGITDWDEKAVVVVTPMMASWGAGYPSMAQRTMAMVHAAMFDAVNSIERRYRPYLVQLPAERSTSEDAAAATAAAAVLATIDPKTAIEMKVALASYLDLIPDGTAKLDGIKLGEAVAARILRHEKMMAANEPDDYRPRTTPGALCANSDHSRLYVAEHEAVCLGHGIPIPAKSADFVGEQGVGGLTSMRSRTTVEKAARSERTSRPKLPGSGS